MPTESLFEKSLLSLTVTDRSPNEGISQKGVKVKFGSFKEFYLDGKN